jgi:uncharacterized protein (TIGR00375 family)
MKIIADLHLHSKYSRAVSQKMELVSMAEWAVKKGIDLLAIPDWTHPLWLKEVEAVIEEAPGGLYQLKAKNRQSMDQAPPVKFVFSTEISSIYSQGGQTRRIHNLVLAPSFSTVQKINDELKKRGCNLMSDGRPIVGLSSIQLAELVLGVDKNCLLVPAHIWTPWFSMFGSKSGFDSLEECWGQYAKEIWAVETGLSSNPLMNWQVGQLKNRSIISSSDAHSPQKMGREATVFIRNDRSSVQPADKEDKRITSEFSYQDLARALKQDRHSDWKIGYTIEFYPEEGKYHWTGHRLCGISLSADQVAQKGTVCPVCGRPLTVGVEQRVSQLGQPSIEQKTETNPAGLIGYYNKTEPDRPPYVMLVPLQEILAEALGLSSVASPKVQNLYDQLVSSIGPEFDLLTQSDLKRVALIAGEKAAEGINKVRHGQIVVKPGFDGQFGIVKIWGKDQSSSAEGPMADKEQMNLF